MHARSSSPQVFIERFVDRPRHIEVQIIGDGKGNVVHLWERDCSVQRRHQKVIEMAPAWSLPMDLRKQLHADAVRLTSEAKYLNAGTVEFLVDAENRYYFIEVNPRIQVEHTVTEEVTSIDVVQTQLRIAGGASLDDIGLKQESIQPRGVAIQCRITTENAERNFAPDTGTISVYRHSSGFGMRQDGIGYSGLTITPYYDSLLVKYTARGASFEETLLRMRRALQVRHLTAISLQPSPAMTFAHRSCATSHRNLPTAFTCHDLRSPFLWLVARPAGGAHPWGADQHPLLAQRAHPPSLRDWHRHDLFHRREPEPPRHLVVDVELRLRRTGALSPRNLPAISLEPCP